MTTSQILQCIDTDDTNPPNGSGLLIALLAVMACVFTIACV